MAITLLTKENASYFSERIAVLTADTPRRWGEMDAVHMLRHLRFSLELSLGEIHSDEVKDISIPVLRNVLYLLFFVVLTKWPQGKIKAPHYFNPPADNEFEEERLICLEALDRFVIEAQEHPERRRMSPILGHIPLSKWQRVHGVHFTHHFRQFGLI